MEGPSPFLLMLAWTLLLETSTSAALPFLCAIYLHGKKPWSYCHGEHCWKVAVRVWLLVLEDQSLSAQTTGAPYGCVRGQRPQASVGLVAPHNSSSGVAAAPAPDLRMVHCSFLSSRAGSPSLDSPICVATASRKLKPSLQLYWLRQAERTTRKYCNREHGIDKPCKWQ